MAGQPSFPGAASTLGTAKSRTHTVSVALAGFVSSVMRFAVPALQTPVPLPVVEAAQSKVAGVVMQSLYASLPLVTSRLKRMTDSSPRPAR